MTKNVLQQQQQTNHNRSMLLTNQVYKYGNNDWLFKKLFKFGYINNQHSDT